MKKLQPFEVCQKNQEIPTGFWPLKNSWRAVSCITCPACPDESRVTCTSCPLYVSSHVLRHMQVVSCPCPPSPPIHVAMCPPSHMSRVPFACRPCHPSPERCVLLCHPSHRPLCPPFAHCVVSRYVDSTILDILVDAIDMATKFDEDYAHNQEVCRRKGFAMYSINKFKKVIFVFKGVQKAQHMSLEKMRPPPLQMQPKFSLVSASVIALAIVLEANETWMHPLWEGTSRRTIQDEVRSIFWLWSNKVFCS